MELDFFKSKLTGSNIETIIPGEDDRNYIHSTIGRELGKGIFKEETKQGYLKIIDKLILQGAQGIILGCTEIPLLISDSDVDVPLFNTTLIHSAKAVEFALSDL